MLEAGAGELRLGPVQEVVTRELATLEDAVDDLVRSASIGSAPSVIREQVRDSRNRARAPDSHGPSSSSDQIRRPSAVSR